MSENTGESQTPNHTVPKERLDEVIARAKAAEQQVAFMQQQLSAAMQRQQPAPVAQIDPEMERMKEENPTLYRKLRANEEQTRQLRAAMFGMADQTDKTQFVLKYGEAGKKRLQDVEAVLEQERQRGNVAANREGIFTWLLGQEKLREDLNRASAPVAPPKEPTAPARTTEVPSTDPSEATVRGSTAAPDYSQLSREDRVKSLENVTF